MYIKMNTLLYLGVQNYLKMSLVCTKTIHHGIGTLGAIAGFNAPIIGAGRIDIDR